MESELSELRRKINWAIEQLLCMQNRCSKDTSLDFDSNTNVLTSVFTDGSERTTSIVGMPTIDTTKPLFYAGDGVVFGDPVMPIDEFVDRAFYATEAASVNLTGGKNIEMGTTGAGLIQPITITVTKNASTTDIASIVVVGSDGTASPDIKTGVGNQVLVYNITLTSNLDTTYTVYVTTVSGDVSTHSTTFNFLYAKYWGRITAGSIPSDADILGLSNKELSETIPEIFDGYNVNNNYFVYAYVSTAGLASFKINLGVSGDFTLVRDNSFINALGETYNIKVYISTIKYGLMNDFRVEKV